MPPDQDDLGRLRDAINFGDKVVRMVSDFDEPSFVVDDKTLFATCYGIQVVGEAIWKLSDEVKKSFPEIPWPLIAGMRHRLVHDYGKTDESIVYQVATIHLPQLVVQLKSVLQQLEKEADGT